MRLGRDPIVHLYFLARDCHDWTYPGMVARGYDMAEDDVLPKIGWLNNYVKDKNGQELLLWFHSPPCCALATWSPILPAFWWNVWWNQAQVTTATGTHRKMFREIGAWWRSANVLGHLAGRGMWPAAGAQGFSHALGKPRWMGCFITNEVPLFTIWICLKLKGSYKYP